MQSISTVAEETSQGITKIADSTDQLDNLAGNLEELLDQFTTDDHPASEHKPVAA